MDNGRATRAGWGLALLALFLLVYGAKSTLIGGAGSPLPYSDQWNFEALGLYRPYIAGTLDWSQMLAPYNEHRMFFTRLLLLGLFELAGGWDPVLAMLVNALLAAVFSVLFTAFVVPVVRPDMRPLVFAFIAFCLVLPLGFENTLMGMNSHFYMFILLSFGGVVLLTRAKGLSGQWFAGFICALATEFTLASGALTPIAAGAVALLQLAVGARSRSAREIVAILLLLVAGAVMALTVSHDAASVSLEVRGIGDFLWAAISVASLPLFPVVGLVIVHAPIVWFLVHVVRERPLREARDWGVLALAAWVAAQILAIAYSRYEMALSSRYLDIIILLLPLDLVALVVAQSRSWPLGTAKWLAIYAGTWLFVVVAATGGAAYFSSWRLAQEEKHQLDDALPKITAFLRTGDAAQLSGIAGWLYPDTAQLGKIISDPAVEPILPDAVRSPEQPSATSKTLLRGRFAGVAAVLKTILSAGPLWLVLGAAVGFLAAFRYLGRGTRPEED